MIDFLVSALLPLSPLVAILGVAFAIDRYEFRKRQRAAMAFFDGVDLYSTNLRDRRSLRRPSSVAAGLAPGRTASNGVEGR